MAKSVKRQKRIWVTDEVTRILKKEFKTTGVSVLNALKFASYSATAKGIRERAQVLMAEVAQNNQQLMDEFHLD